MDNVIQSEWRENDLFVTVIHFITARTRVEYTAGYDCSQRYEVSAEQQINSRLFAYFCC